MRRRRGRYFNSQPREGGWGSACSDGKRQHISTHSRAKAAGESAEQSRQAGAISTHSRAKAAGKAVEAMKQALAFQLTAARRRLARTQSEVIQQITISTHSRAKAAGRRAQRRCGLTGYFNSQPREGGWIRLIGIFTATRDFNSQPREGGWLFKRIPWDTTPISTHSRAKAAGDILTSLDWIVKISTHSRAKAAG